MTPRTLSRWISPLMLLAPLAVGCSNSEAGSLPQVTGPCADAESLTGVAMLEIEDMPESSSDGVELGFKLAAELGAACKKQGYDKTAPDALACYKKNRKAAGYRVFKGCDDKPGKAIVAAVVATYNGTAAPDQKTAAGEKAERAGDTDKKVKRAEAETETGATTPTRPAATARKPAPAKKPKKRQPCTCSKGDVMCQMRCSQR